MHTPKIGVDTERLEDRLEEPARARQLDHIDLTGMLRGREHRPVGLVLRWLSAA
jgi:hypothetical protein